MVLVSMGFFFFCLAMENYILFIKMLFHDSVHGSIMLLAECGHVLLKHQHNDNFKNFCRYIVNGFQKVSLLIQFMID